jgi:hypothetical protein
VALTQPNAGVERELHREQLERPRRSLPPEILWRTVDVPHELHLYPVRDLARRPQLALIEERVLAKILEAVQRAVHGGAGAAHHLGDDAGDDPFVEQQQDSGARGLDPGCGSFGRLGRARAEWRGRASLP